MPRPFAIASASSMFLGFTISSPVSTPRVPVRAFTTVGKTLVLPALCTYAGHVEHLRQVPVLIAASLHRLAALERLEHRGALARAARSRLPVPLRETRRRDEQQAERYDC